jgi:imidazolonepropionase-like amidohydrolase
MHLPIPTGSGSFAALLALVGACSIPSTAQSRTQVFTHATVIDGTGVPPRRDVTILVSNGRVAALQPGSAPIPAGATVVDLTGKYVIPGLIDAHVHLGTQLRPPGVMAAILNAALLGGVTSVRDMGGQLDIVRPLARRGVSDTSAIPRIVYAAIMAGPGMWTDGPRAQFFAGEAWPGQSLSVRRVNTIADVPAAITAAKASGASAIKMYNSLDAPVVRALADEARRQGLAVWSHFYVDPAPPSNVVAAGASVVSHADGFIYETMSDASRRGPLDSVRAARAVAFARTPLESPKVRDLIALMRKRNTILDATLFIMRASPDSVGRLDDRRVQLFHEAVGFARRFHEAGGEIDAGTDAIGGSTPNLHTELQLLVDSVGLTPLEAIRAATLVSAQALGISDSLGTIAVGKVADLVVLNADPTTDIANTLTVSAVMKAGRLYRRDRPMSVTPGTRPPVR